MHLLGEPVFDEGRCKFVDIRHAVSRATGLGDVRSKVIVTKIAHVVWPSEDPLSALFSVLFGDYPDPTGDTIDYPKGIRRSLEMLDLEMRDKLIAPGAEAPAEVVGSITPVRLTEYGMSWFSDRFSSNWLNPGILIGDALAFDDLLLFWNLRAAGAEVWFYDQAHSARLRLCGDAFIATLRSKLASWPNALNVWSRTEQWTSDLDMNGIAQSRCRGAEREIWNGLNILPVRPSFSRWHRDVVSNYAEDDNGARASFALPDRPFDDEGPSTFDQHFVVTVNVLPYGQATENLTFNTPFVPALNEFYGRNFYWGSDEARVEQESLGHGAIGIITEVRSQRLEIRAIRVDDWMRHFFELFGVRVKRSEPGRRCTRLIRQLDGIQGCRVLKVRGARELIGKYGPDQSFTRSGATSCIGNNDPITQQPRFKEFEHLHIRPHQGKLTPGEVFRYLVSRGVFRVGLNLKCTNCELESWIPLDDVKTMSACVYCGQHFDVTSQLKDRDWRYRRSGLFGRDDDQLGGIPVALALQQLDTSLHDHLLMYSTALEFESQTVKMQRCEADFVAVLAGRPNLREAPIQILIGEAKTSSEIDADDVRKLGMLADAIPAEIAQAYIMFAKTDTFTAEEVALAKSLNSPGKQRVILWSRDELEPYLVYERSQDRVPNYVCGSSLADMVTATNILFFGS